MKTDIDFLFDSDFTKIFNFSDNHDPLLIIPSKLFEGKGLKFHEFQKVLSIPASIAKRVKLAEQYIFDEGINNAINRLDTNTVIQDKIKFDQKLAKLLLEDLLEESYGNELRNIPYEIQEDEYNVYNVAIMKVLDDNIIEEALLKYIKEIVLQLYQELTDGPIKKHLDEIASKYIAKEIDVIIREIIKEERSNVKALLKESSKNENKYKKEKEKIYKKRKQEEASLESKLIREKDENEKKRKAQESFKKIVDEDNYQISLMILDNLLKELHIDTEVLASSIYKEEIDLNASMRNQQSFKLNIIKISAQILRALIDEEINSIDLKKLAEGQLKKSIEIKKSNNFSEAERKQQENRESSIQLDRVAELIYANLFDDLLIKMNLSELINKIIEKIVNYRNSRMLDVSLIKSSIFDQDDYSLDEFTPREDSQMLYGISEENKFEKRAIYQFAIEGEFLDADNIQWIPIGIDEKNAEDIIGEYYSCLSSKILNVIPTVPQLFIETYKGIDPCWY